MMDYGIERGYIKATQRFFRIASVSQYAREKVRERDATYLKSTQQSLTKLSTNVYTYDRRCRKKKEKVGKRSYV